MIKDLMGKLNIQDTINDNNAKINSLQNMTSNQEVKTAQTTPKPPIPPKPPQESSNLEEKTSKSQIINNNSNLKFNYKKKEVLNMDDEGIIIDLGEGISLNVPIKKKMTLHEFLKVAEKVKALEMLAEE
jgi:alpha-galactosidase/6-phospho-beta-glucosidase family protein